MYDCRVQVSRFSESALIDPRRGNCSHTLWTIIERLRCQSVYKATLSSTRVLNLFNDRTNYVEISQVRNLEKIDAKFVPSFIISSNIRWLIGDFYSLFLRNCFVIIFFKEN